MNRDRIEGSCLQVAGSVRTMWCRLTCDHLGEMAGRRDRLAGKLQVRRGICADAANKPPLNWYKGTQG
jgi:uncharacterized protein YjbJ (UPF0337 family)